MYNRKSLTPSRSSIQGANSSNKNNRSHGLFQLSKCNVCQIEIIKKDISKHSEHICKLFIESFFDLKNEECCTENLLDKDVLFENPFLINTNCLYTSVFSSLNKDKLHKDEILESYDDTLLLTPELMEHCQIANGNYISVFDLNENVLKGYFLVRSSDQLKNFLSIGFSKDSNIAKIFNKKESNNYRINFKLTITPLRYLHLFIKKKFIDPFYYLTSCKNIKKRLEKKLINSKDSHFSIQINENEFKLEIKKFICDLPELEDKLKSLSISQKDDFEKNSVFLISSDTEIIFTSETKLNFENTNINFSGYEKQIELLRNIIIKPWENKLNLSLPRKVLLTGPSGTGKTLAVYDIFKGLHSKMNIFNIHCSTFLSKSFEFEKLRIAFKNLSILKPSVLFLDNLEDISSEKNQIEKKLVSWLKVLFDNLPKNEHVFVICATSRPELLDQSLRRPGRLDIEIDFPVPSPNDRKNILKEILSHSENNLTDDEISKLAECAHGFTGADLQHLCEITQLNSIETRSFSLSYNKLIGCIGRIKPSIMREITLEKPNVSWSDIGGLHELRHLLEECVVWPIKHPEAFLRLSIEPPKGILMYGPPGCCKTMIGKALASESGLNFFSIKGPELFNKWVGESERAIREIFRKARTASPSILFFDEIDALASERGQSQSAVGDRVLAQLLTEIDGVEKLSQVVIIAATNRPDIVDKALLRPGRLDSMVYVPLPDLATRKEIFNIRTKKMPLDKELDRNELIDQLALMSEGYTGAEVSAVCQRAGLIALSEQLSADSVTKNHFLKAFQQVRPRIPPEMISFYDEFTSSSNEMKHVK